MTCTWTQNENEGYSNADPNSGLYDKFSATPLITIMRQVHRKQNL
jgi:hypothetical protein